MSGVQFRRYPMRNGSTVKASVTTTTTTSRRPSRVGQAVVSTVERKGEARRECRAGAKRVSENR